MGESKESDKGREQRKIGDKILERVKDTGGYN